MEEWKEILRGRELICVCGDERYVMLARAAHEEDYEIGLKR